MSGVVESLKIITRAKSERIAKFAFSFALANNRKKVTCIHKANIMKLADGLFRNTFQAVAQEYPTLETNDMIVDNASMQAVSRPQQFDVMVMPNLYGGILSNIGAALVGGPGIVPGCNMGREVAVFEPGCRHVGLDIKGKDQANPTAMILSGSMLLRHLGLDEHANHISKAVYDVISQGYWQLSGSVSTKLTWIQKNKDTGYGRKCHDTRIHPCGSRPYGHVGAQLRHLLYIYCFTSRSVVLRKRKNRMECVFIQLQSIKTYETSIAFAARSYEVP